MIKKCYRCYKDKDEEEFPLFKSKRKGICTECYKQHYGDPAEKAAHQAKKQTEANRRATKLLKIKKRKYMLDFLKKTPCHDCGLIDPVVMEFDHRDPILKENEISRLMGCHYPINALLLEMSKCDVVCANCHRHRSAKMFGSYKLDYVED